MCLDCFKEKGCLCLEWISEQRKVGWLVKQNSEEILSKTAGVGRCGPERAERQDRRGESSEGSWTANCEIANAFLRIKLAWVFLV